MQGRRGKSKSLNEPIDGRQALHGLQRVVFSFLVSYGPTWTRFELTQESRLSALSRFIALYSYIDRQGGTMRNRGFRAVSQLF